jgi:hypothetical protein
VLNLRWRAYLPLPYLVQTLAQTLSFPKGSGGGWLQPDGGDGDEAGDAAAPIGSWPLLHVSLLVAIK